jgi:drug/metabolite transporter (DMT)-like permease
MNLHKITGRWRLGVTLSLTTVFLWGMLPIALKEVLNAMDPYTITWYRFLIAAGLLGMWLAFRKGLSPFSRLRSAGLWLIGFAAVVLCINYVTYLLGLDYMSPSMAQVVIQLAPLFLLLGSLLFFKERFSARQWGGVAVLTVGMFLFFNKRLLEILFEMDTLTKGVLLIVISALAWAAYALVQKQLLRSLPSSFIIFLLYFLGTFLFLPTARPAEIAALSFGQVLLLVFSGLNTLVAYACFAEALNHIEASRVSVVLAITPLMTMIMMAIGAVVFPSWIASEGLSALSISGACLVVSGSIICAWKK